MRHALSESLKIEIQEFAGEDSSFADPIIRWQYSKYKCREFRTFWKFLDKNVKRKKGKTSRTRKETCEIRGRGLISSNSNRSLLEEYSKYKSYLESVSEWYEHDEKSSKYFLNLEKRKKAKPPDTISKPPDITPQVFNVLELN